MLPAIALAQAQAPAPVVKSISPVKGTVTIQAIDQTARLITVRDDKGMEDIIWAPPDFKRFNEIKVGQKLNLQYYESLVVKLAAPGAKPQGLTASGAIAPAGGATPGGTIARQFNATVEVTGIDPKTPSITVRTADGRTITRKVEDVKNLTGVKVGDKLDITYTQAALVNISQ
jgi:Cu/Ag efflux protein CusF